MGPEPLATQATAHSLHTQAWVATRPLAKQCHFAVGLHLRNPSLMDYYSFNRPRRDGRLSRPFWLTDSGHFTHKEVTRPAASLAQDRESTPAEPAVLTTMPRHHLSCGSHVIYLAESEIGLYLYSMYNLYTFSAYLCNRVYRVS